MSSIKAIARAVGIPLGKLKADTCDLPWCLNPKAPAHWSTPYCVEHNRPLSAARSRRSEARKQLDEALGQVRYWSSIVDQSEQVIEDSENTINAILNDPDWRTR